MSWETVIGLEVHCQLQTAEKLFCGCPTTFGAEPNTHTCPVCLGHPGVLPVTNDRAVELALRVGLAVGCEVNRHSVFARKHYFYPDLPKAYQITQYEQPILEHGHLDIEARRVRILRIHMEEDAGKSLHEAPGATHVDLNRAGTPLVEVVSEPDMRSSAEAVEYLKSLHALVRALDACDGNLEEGSFRCDANVSVRRPGAPLGTRTELKNLNTFKGVQRAIDYEVERQTDLLEAGGEVVQETRLWDDAAGKTRAMRSKEDAHDYRYFPDPDLPPLELSEARVEAIRSALPELPAARKRRFVEGLGLSAYDAGVLVAERTLADYYEAAVAAHDNPKALSNWVTTELLGRVDDLSAAPPPQDLGRLVALIDDQTISGRIAKTVFEGMLAGEGTPDAIVAARGLKQVTDEGAIEAAVRAVVEAHPEQLAQFRDGKTKVRGFFVGRVMRATQGKANPQQVNAILDRLLAE